jgi:hypothetical protein
LRAAVAVPLFGLVDLKNA